MDDTKKNSNIVHPRQLLKKEQSGVGKFNTALALKITNGVGSMWSAYLFAVLSLFSLPAILVLVSPHLRHTFPKWIIATSLITLIAWVSQNFLQLVLLPVIMVGQNVIQGRQEAKADADHRNLTYLTNLQEEQIAELKKQTSMLDELLKKS